MDLSPGDGRAEDGAAATPQAGKSLSPCRKVTTGLEDHVQLEWLVEKLARELSDSRRREAKIQEDVAQVVGNMEQMQAALTGLIRENAALKTRASMVGDVQKERVEHSVAKAFLADAEASASKCDVALEEMRSWFDDRAQLQAVVDAQQQEIFKLSSTVRALTKAIETVPQG
eukprot:TRINITY_DN15081_c0_g1_i1.p1 TRINITY_DN15081_c0_g1~~TRINITY_DN15081_c0_g1_i1.p1  ORF type:complete len:172 (+),score=72.82 TRINITY_DN15081_c0_g1_i1:127-642(+)